MKHTTTLLSLFFLACLVKANQPTDSLQWTKATTAQKENSGIHFLENKGQLTDENGNEVPFVLFKAAQRGVDIYITKTGITYVFLKAKEEHHRKKNFKNDREETEMEYSRVDVKLKGVHIEKGKIECTDTATELFNYYLGHCPKGIMNVHGFKKFTIRAVYPGIDWEWSIKGNKIEQDFIVAPGADASVICMQYHWTKLKLEKDGKVLHISTPIGELSEGGVVSYCSKKEIDTRYLLDTNKNEVRFGIADYDHNETLRIDPPMQLVWGTYVAGNGADGLWAVCADGSGNIYSAGEAIVTTYPTLNPGNGAYFQGTSVGSWDVNLCKFGLGNNLVWCTLFGGNSGDAVYGAMDVDSIGNLYLTSCTQSTNLPTRNPGNGAFFDNTLNGSQDIFIAHFAPTGALVWSTYFGGNSTGSVYQDGEIGTDLKIKNGRVYITGMADHVTGFPLLNAGGGAYYQTTTTGTKDAFIAVFDTGGVQLWTSFLGGSLQDEGWALNVNDSANIFVAGRTSSTNFPTLNPMNGSYFQSTVSGGFEGFLTKFNFQFVMQYSTYWGGNGTDNITNIGFHGADTYISGTTSSSNLPLAIPGGLTYYQNTGGLFVNRFNSSFNSVWGTNYGGYHNWGSSGIYNSKSMAIDTAGNVIIVGTSISPSYNPGGNAYYNTNAGGGLVMFNNQNQRIWSTRFGSSAGCWANSVCFGPDGDIFSVGEMQGVPITIQNPGGNAYYDTIGGTQDNGSIARFGSLINHSLYVSLNANSGCDSCSGSAVASAAFGTPPYIYHWLPTNDTTASIINACVGTYTVTVTDANNDSVTSSVNIMLNPNLITTSTSSTASLCGGANGTATVIPSGGNGSFNYLWNNGGVTGTISNLLAGNYFVTITSGACSKTDTVAINSSGSPVLFSYTAHNVFCALQNTTSATVIATSGASPFSYLWSNGSDSSVISNLSTGTYFITVTSAQGCTASDSIHVTASLAVTLSASSTNTSCGNNNGSVSVTVTTGAAPFNYLWNNGGVVASLNNLPSGNYIVTVSDAYNCSAAASVQIDTSNSISATIASDKPIMCTGDSAHVCVTTAHGSYLWNLGQTTQCIYTKQAGNYYVTVTDGNCTATSNHVAVNIYPLPPVSISVNGDTLSAFNASSYQWYLNDVEIVNATSNICIAPQAGYYSVAITDSNGCRVVSNNVFVGGTRIENLNDDKRVELYPNPSSGNCELRIFNFEYKQPLSVFVFDVEGRKVFEQKIIAATTRMNLLMLESGVYFLRVEGKDFFVTKKMVKE